MIWTAAAVVCAVVVAQATALLYVITDFKADVNRRFGEVIARIERLEEHLFKKV